MKSIQYLNLRLHNNGKHLFQIKKGNIFLVNKNIDLKIYIKNKTLPILCKIPMDKDFFMKNLNRNYKEKIFLILEDRLLEN